ncbi:MAG TPA: TlyA family RNA methyltransferase [Candidatus Scatomorpha merdipullorum]|uniref:TlyA family RNA methyltransferase n=1 Tax=Candidatus Scatomorpha merdipullorum TaxID=2840927 RepID=A0A9D1FEI3_9FIRM|nr:TlyA family RNA methyltransferase [Candidatus Scatomorpha merdipullorum]
MKGKRLDQRLTELGLAESREKAKATIMSGLVYVNGQKSDKPGTPVSDDARIEVRGAACPWVSRGGFKLAKALEVFEINPAGYVCIDCGASTGGFTDVLLKNGAARVYAVDVGYGQLAWSLRTDARVTVMERTNARNLTPDMFPESMDMAVMDLSFISIRLILPAVHALLKPEGECVCLIKPQFEAGRADVGKKGVVRDRAVHERVLSEMLEFFPAAGYTLTGLDYSPIRGPEGNIEYLAHLKRGEHAGISPDIAAIVAASHGELDKHG